MSDPDARFRRGELGAIGAGAVVALASVTALFVVTEGVGGSSSPGATASAPAGSVDAETCEPPRPAVAEREGGAVIAANREAEVLSLLRGEGGADEVTLESVSVRSTWILARIAPASGGGALVLLPRGASASPLVRSRSFDIERCGGADAEAMARQARRIAARDDGSLWSAPSRGGAPRERRDARAVLVALGAALGLALLLCVLGPIAPRRPQPAPAARSSPARLLAGLAAALALAFAAYALTTFRFASDDFGYLVRTIDGGVDDTLKWLSVTARFRALAHVGSSEWAFAALNLTALAGSSATWGVLLGRAGCDARASVLAAALFAMGPGVFLLLRWASGFEHLAAQLYVLLVLLLVDVALRARVRRLRRVGVVLLASCLACCAVFVKPPVVTVLPLLAALWAWGAARATLPVALALLALLGLSVLAPLILLDPGGPTELGLPDLGRDLAHYVGGHLRATLGEARGALLALALVLAFGALRRVRERAPFPAPADVLAKITAALRDRRALAIAMGAAGAAAPFVVRGGHYPEYYALLAYLPVAAALAIALVTALDATGAPAWLAVVCALSFVPGSQIQRNLAAREATESEGVWPEHGFEPWLEEVARRARDLPEPSAVLVRSACDDPESRADVQAFDWLVGADGIRWATGWRRADVRFEGGDGERAPEGPLVVIGHCRGRPPHVAAP